MDYKITGSDQTIYAKDTGVTQFGNIYSQGISNTIYLIAYVAAAPSYGTNRIVGTGVYNLLNYMGSPGAVNLDLSKGVAYNGYGGTDYFSGITGVQLSSFDDIANGSSASETFYLASGNDTVYGGGGFDVVTFYSAQSKDYQVSYDLAADMWTVVSGKDTKRLYQIDELQFGDKVYVSEAPVTLSNGKALSFAGSWTAIDAVSSKVSGQLANTFHSLIKLGNSNYYSLVNTGWGYSGFDTTLKIPSNVNISLLTPDSSGSLSLNTSKYISDTSTWGGGSVVVADFNSDGSPDIFLAAHNESPAVAEPSTVYLSNAQGTFTKVVLSDLVAAHDASLFYSSGKAMVVASTYAGNAAPVYKYVNGQFTVTDVNLNYQVYANSAEHYGGSATVIAPFGKSGTLQLVRGDTLSYSSATWDTVSNSTIKVFSYVEPNSISAAPIQTIPAYLSTLPEYKNFKSYLGVGITHITRVWSDDLNHDGSLDVLATQSMWSDGSDVFPSALQVLINQGDGTFVDKTAKLNPDVPLTIQELDYTPSMVDIDKSGINTILLAGIYTPTPARHSNFVLLNDGTGRLYIGMHDQFVTATPAVYELLNKQFADNSNYWIGTYSAATSIPKYIGLPQPDGSINFVAEISTSVQLVNGLSQSQYQYVNVPLQYNPTTDFAQDIVVSDRNQSKIIRTWAGNDTFKDANANTGAARLDGGLGVDTSIYTGNVKEYSVTALGNGSFQVKRIALEGVPLVVDDTLVKVERLRFSDVYLALDLDGNAGIAAKILGSVFGKTAVANKEYLGIGLDLLDKGMSYDTLAGLALGAARATTNDQIVTTLWTNVVGSAPSATDKAPFIKMLEDGMTPGALAQMAADTSINIININLVGLAQTGIEYTPVS